MLRYLSTAALHLLNLVLALAVLVNLMGCIWWFVAELEGLENSFAAHTGGRKWGNCGHAEQLARGRPVPGMPAPSLKPTRTLTRRLPASPAATQTSTSRCWRHLTPPAGWPPSTMQ